MRQWLPVLVVLAVAYAVGGIPFALIISRARGTDIRRHGSGNVGATNVFRVCGRIWGVLCFFCDAGKGFIPVAVALHVPGLRAQPHAELLPVAALFGAVAGHVWTPYLRFKGGKGVATSAGGVLALAPLPLLLTFAVWFAVLRLSRYVSLASITAAAALPLLAWLCARLRLPMSQAPPPVMVLLVALAVLAIARHYSNIGRLLNGTESRFDRKRRDANADSSSQ